MVRTIIRFSEAVHPQPYFRSLFFNKSPIGLWSEGHKVVFYAAN